MDCHWCRGGLARLDDEAIVRRFNEALESENDELFAAAMNDLMHSLYHKTRRSLDHDDAMDVVLDTMKQLWGLLKRNQKHAH